MNPVAQVTGQQGYRLEQVFHSLAPRTVVPTLGDGEFVRLCDHSGCGSLNDTIVDDMYPVGPDERGSRQNLLDAPGVDDDGIRINTVSVPVDHRPPRQPHNTQPQHKAYAQLPGQTAHR